MNVGIRMNIESAKWFFFDRAHVEEKIGKRAVKALSRFGAFVRTRSKTSMKRARRKTLAEMSPREKRIHAIRVRAAQKRGASTPKRPFKPSKPGEPPRVRAGTLKRHVYFGLEPQRKNVVIGPILFEPESGAPEILEHGGVTRNRRRAKVEPRPYMRPAFDREIDNLPRHWRHSLLGS